MAPKNAAGKFIEKHRQRARQLLNLYSHLTRQPPDGDATAIPTERRTQILHDIEPHLDWANWAANKALRPGDRDTKFLPGLPPSSRSEKKVAWPDEWISNPKCWRGQMRWFRDWDASWRATQEGARGGGKEMTLKHAGPKRDGVEKGKIPQLNDEEPTDKAQGSFDGKADVGAQKGGDEEHEESVNRGQDEEEVSRQERFEEEYGQQQGGEKDKVPEEQEDDDKGAVDDGRGSDRVAPVERAPRKQSGKRHSLLLSTTKTRTTTSREDGEGNLNNTTSFTERGKQTETVDMQNASTESPPALRLPSELSFPSLGQGVQEQPFMISAAATPTGTQRIGSLPQSWRPTRSSSDHAKPGVAPVDTAAPIADFEAHLTSDVFLERQRGRASDVGSSSMSLAEEFRRSETVRGLDSISIQSTCERWFADLSVGAYPPHAAGDAEHVALGVGELSLSAGHGRAERPEHVEGDTLGVAAEWPCRAGERCGKCPACLKDFYEWYRTEAHPARRERRKEKERNMSVEGKELEDPVAR